MDRRDFLKKGLLWGTGCLLWGGSPSYAKKTDSIPQLKEASFYKKLDDGRVECTLCPLGEKMKEGQRSVCRVRVVHQGKLYVENYGRPSALHQDPIEKNPLYHFIPGMKALALSTAGCNLACPACQNWEMSQKRVADIKVFNLMPDEAVQYAKKYKCKAISYTYTEPVIFYEYFMDLATRAKSAGLKNCVVTGGYVNPQPLKKMVQASDAFVVSIKGISDEEYGGVCPDVYPVLQNSLKIIKSGGKWLEVAILTVPSRNDQIEQLKAIAGWIKNNLGTDTPIHFSRFYPSFKLKNLPQTPVSLLEKIRQEVLSMGMKYVYIGNVPGHEGNNTYCHCCKKLLVQRVGFRILKNHIQEGKCVFCNTPIPGVWQI